MKLHDVEKISVDYNKRLLAYRRAVPGGWLYVEIGTAEVMNHAVAAVFVPDPTAEHVLAAAKTEGDQG